MLIGVFVLAAYGKFEGATDAAKYLTIGVAAATGILAIISQWSFYHDHCRFSGCLRATSKEQEEDHWSRRRFRVLTVKI
jgi:NADH:ubiquinone oxidoreductase subunit 2 (subunit N)